MLAYKIIDDNQDLMIITNSGMIIRLSLNQISQLGRVTQGVKLINLKDNQYVSTISIVDKEDGSDITENSDDLSTINENGNKKSE